MVLIDSPHIHNVKPEFVALLKTPPEGKKLNYLMVLPIQPINEEGYGFPTGFAYISSSLKVSGRKVLTLNLNHVPNPYELLKNEITGSNIDVVLTGGTSIEFLSIKAVIDTAKEARLDVITIVGGAIITADPETAMEALEVADYGMIGEGEISICELVYALETKNDAAGVGGSICRRDGNWVVNEAYRTVHDLDILPFPDYEGFQYDKYLTNFKDRILRSDHGCTNIAILNVCRSCPYRCTFCLHKQRGKYRLMSMDNAFRLIDHMLSLYPAIDGIWIPDEMLISSPKFAIEFSQRIKDYNIPWRCSARINTVARESLAAMKDGGCVHILVGIESADNGVLKSMRKKITIEQVEQVIDWASEFNLKIQGALIFGDPVETKETFWRTITWQQAHRENVLGMTKIAAYPGLQIYDVACERGLIKDKIQYLKDGVYIPDRLINISQIPDDDFQLYNPFLIGYFMHNGAVLSDVKADINDDLSVNISGRCPWCMEILFFESFQSFFKLYPTPCPYCDRDISVNLIELYETEALKVKMEGLVQEASVAVWPITIFNFYWLYRVMPALREESVRLINKNVIVNPYSGYSIKTVEGKVVHSPDIIRQENIDTVIVPGIPDVYAEIKQQCKAEFPTVENILHIAELV